MKKPFGKTIRQELVDHAVLKLHIWREEGFVITPGMAIESVLDGVRPNTLGGLMLEYTDKLSESGWRRLECEIMRVTK